MKKTRINKRISLSELSEKTGIDHDRLYRIENGASVVVGWEELEIKEVLGSDVKFYSIEQVKENLEAMVNTPTTGRGAWKGITHNGYCLR